MSFDLFKKFHRSKRTKSYEFTEDWFSHNSPIWSSQLKRFANVPRVNFLEIGSFEGMSTCWLLDNILTHPSAKLTCIEPNFRDVFDENIAKTGAAGKVTKLVGLSQDFLGSLSANSYDMIYIDGNHSALYVLKDALLTWRIVKIGGLIIFDDYEWTMYPEDSDLHPKRGIDNFLSLVCNDIEMIYKDYQIIIKKISNRTSFEVENVIQRFESQC